jgi:ribosomal protein S21
LNTHRAIGVTLTDFEIEMSRRGDKAGALDSMLSRFNRIIATHGILKELKKHEAYEKPSSIKARAKREAAGKQRKITQKENELRNRNEKVRPNTARKDSIPRRYSPPRFTGKPPELREKEFIQSLK